jgi:HNH endonuclease
MLWREAVLSSLKAYAQRHATHVIQRQDFIAEEMEAISSATQSQGATPTQTLSRVLQDLRDRGAVEFLDPGSYLLLDVPIDVEAEDLSDDAIDHALRATRLRFGFVPTDSQPAIIRQRRGQARLRALALEAYQSCCAVCDITDSSLLVTSHIVGWAEDPEHRGDLSNVICLCRIHDALFEAGLWALDDDLSLLKQSVESKMLSLLLDAMTCFRLPLQYPPGRAHVRRHRRRVGFGN